MEPDRLALLRGILAFPDDDLRRLVFADWLDENGTTDADTARTEFIRLGCGVRAKKAISPVEGKWLDANWRRLLPRTVGVLSESEPLTAIRKGRRVGLHPAQAEQPDKRVYTFQVRVWFDFFRGFAVRVLYGDARHYLRCWDAAASDEPLADHAAYFMPPWSRVDDHPEPVSPEMWGQRVFDRLDGCDLVTGTRKRFLRRAPVLAIDNPAERHQAALTAALTAVAREYTGLVHPAEPGAAADVGAR